MCVFRFGSMLLGRLWVEKVFYVMVFMVMEWLGVPCMLNTLLVNFRSFLVYLSWWVMILWVLLMILLYVCMMVMLLMVSERDL